MRIRALLASTALLASSSTVAGAPPAAQAAGDGCGWDRYGMLDNWQASEDFHRANGNGDGVVKITAVEDYTQCRNPNVAERKIKHRQVTVCWYFPQGYADANFNGASIEVHYWNKWGNEAFGDKFIEVDPVSIPRNGQSEQECSTVSLTSSGGHKVGNMINQWWLEDTTPVWAVDYWIRFRDPEPDKFGYLSVADWGPDPAGYSFAYATHLKRIIPGNDVQYAGPF